MEFYQKALIAAAIGCIGAVTLVACSVTYSDETRSHPTESTEQYTIRCIDGVKYWYRKAGYGKELAPVIDRDTLTFVRC